MTNTLPQDKLQHYIDPWFSLGSAADVIPDALAAFHTSRHALEPGVVRAAEPDASVPTGWRVNAWVKRGILLGFRIGQMTEMGSADGLSFVDKATYPARRFGVADGVRVVPGGSSVRSGAYLAKGVV